MSIRKIKGSYVSKGLEEYVGELTYLFYDTASGELRLCDGTPGGIAPRYPTATIDITETIGNPSHNTLDITLDHMYSAGIIAGGGFTDNGDGTIDINGGTCYIRGIDDSHSTLYLAEFAGITNLALTDNSTNYVYIDYNNGAPSPFVTLDPLILNVTTKVPHCIINREGLSLNVILLANDSVDANAKLRKRLFYAEERFAHAFGAIISNPSLLYIAITAGVFYFGLGEINTPALDTSISGTFEYYYTGDSGATWTETDETQMSQTQYNDVTSGLVALGANKYTNSWIYTVPSTEGTEYYAVLYGQQEYTTPAGYLAEPPPLILPPSVKQIGILLGVMTVEGGNGVVSSRTAFPPEFNAAVVTSHLDLSDIGLTSHAQIDAQITLTGTGSPEGVVTAPIGRLYTDSTGGVGSTLYVKETGAGPTGWVAK